MNDRSFDELSDQALAARAGAGDDGAFREIVRRHDPQLRALVRRVLRDDGNVADDVMQEAYLKAFRALDRFRGQATLATWLYRITYNACVDHMRRARFAPVADADDGAEPAWTGPNPADVASTRHVLGQALTNLDARRRAVVLLVDGQGLDYAEAAAVLGVRPGTVASRLSRARADLRRALEPAMAEAA